MTVFSFLLGGLYIDRCICVRAYVCMYVCMYVCICMYVCMYVYIYIYIIYTPNLGLGIAVSVRKREQGRFRGSTEGAEREQEGA